MENVEQLFEWFRYGLSEVVFVDDEWYNGDPLVGADEVGFVMWYNKPVSP